MSESGKFFSHLEMHGEHQHMIIGLITIMAKNWERIVYCLSLNFFYPTIKHIYCTMCVHTYRDMLGQKFGPGIILHRWGRIATILCRNVMMFKDWGWGVSFHGSAVWESPEIPDGHLTPAYRHRMKNSLSIYIQIFRLVSEKMIKTFSVNLFL